MKSFRFGVGAAALATIAACATSDDRRSGAEPDVDRADGGGASLPDSPKDGGDAVDPIEPKELERCSSDGWCVTKLPDVDLDLRDIHPFEARAFAVAESITLGIQFLEWEKATDAWRYIGEGGQNQFDRGKYAGDMWAASENEVYFTLAPAFVYHGIRPDPSSPFTWRVARLDAPEPGDAGAPAHDPGRVWAANVAAKRYDPTKPPYDYFAPSLGVDGVPWGEVYAWYGPTLFRHTVAQNGDDQWVVEHTLTDAEHPDDEFHIQSIAGGAADDFWIGGVRSRVTDDGVRERACPLAVQRRADGYHHFLDHVVNPTGDPTNLLSNLCDAKPGAMRLLARLEVPGYDFVLEYEYGDAGWMRSLRHIAPNTVVALNGANNLVYLQWDEEMPLARVNGIEHAPSPIEDLSLRYNALWTGEDGAWVAGNGLMLSFDYAPTNWSRGVGILNSGTAGANVMQATTFTLSSIARNGVPLGAPLHQVRGTSNSNLWAIGHRHAFHRTKP